MHAVFNGNKVRPFFEAWAPTPPGQPGRFPKRVLDRAPIPSQPLCNYGFDYWGPGTLVTVTSEQSSAPKVFPLVSCCGLESSANVAIGCLVKDFLPEPAEVTWKAGSEGKISTGIITTPAIKIASNNLFSITSYLKVKPADLDSKKYQCMVKHKSLSSEVTKEVSNEVCKPMKTLDPTVHLMLPSCEERTSFDLTCLLSNYLPNNLNVKWLVNGKEKISPVSKFEALKASDSTFMGKSQFRVNKEEWDSGALYTCHVTRVQTAKVPFDDMYNISKCSACLSGMSAPVVHLIRPSYEDILTGKAYVACLVVGHDLHSTQIIWEINGKTTTPTLEKIVSHTNKSQSQWSKIQVTREQWKTPQRYSCKTSHPCFTESKQELTTKESTYQLRTPSVALLSSDAEDPFKMESLTLFCDITGFYPQDISIEWKNNMTQVQKSRYFNGPIVRSGAMYSTYSLLRVGKNEGSGAYTCEVDHETLKTPKAETIQDVFALQTPSPPEVTIQHAVADEPNKVLLCVSKLYLTKNINMTWRVEGKVRHCGATSKEALGNGRVYSTCSLNITKEEWAEGHAYSCHVQYQNGTRNADIERVVHSVGYQMVPPFSNITRPSFEELFRHKKSTIKCRAEIRRANITWKVNGKSQEEGVTMIPTGSNWTESTLSISLSEWNATAEVACQPQYNSILFPQQTISRTLRQMRTPVISLLPPSTEEVSASEILSLVCLVKDFYPEEIFVAWENGTEAELHPYDDTMVKCNHIMQRCSLTSLLTVQRTEWLAGTIYTCTVGHISSERTLKKSISHNTGKTIPDGNLRDFHDQGGFDLNELDEAGSVWTTASTFIALFLLTLLYSSFVTFVKVK